MAQRHSDPARIIARAATGAAFLIAAGAGAFSGARAAAPAYPQDVGGWTLAESSDGKGCFLTRIYDHRGDTTLLLGLDVDGSNHLSVLNANWSIKPKERLKLTFRLSGGTYPRHFAVGMASDGKQGFVTNFEAKFLPLFAASRDLFVANGAVPVERLPLDGSGAALGELRKCVAAQRAKPAPAPGKTTKSDDIPEDPFAPANRDKRRR
ncbi:hypothetical protein [Sphingomonas sp.]|uniref:hypothetical protein n=1 Tax=Sphingomonas sp. TaxID=28214 RepID=UPI003B3B854F